MKANEPADGTTVFASPSAAQISVRNGWTLHEYAVCSSTNLAAAGLPAWSAVRADRQTQGRGRFERRWVSDQGGLWLSAVVPLSRERLRFFPVAMGLALCEALAAVGVKELRLRWPNDVLVRDRKLAGLLLDQFVPELVVVGVGINVSNFPEVRDESLMGQTARLVELVPNTPSLAELMVEVLGAVRAVWSQLEASGPESLLVRVNPLWQAPRTVRLELDGGEIQGQFIGVDAQGRLELRVENRLPQVFEPHEVHYLRDL